MWQFGYNWWATGYRNSLGVLYIDSLAHVLISPPFIFGHKFRIFEKHILRTNPTIVPALSKSAEWLSRSQKQVWDQHGSYVDQWMHALLEVKLINLN